MYFAIEMERSDLYDRINTRCTHMWDLGLLHETVKLLDMGFSTELNSLNTVGYKEAMGNGTERLKSMADEVIGSVDNDGLAELIESL